MQLSDVSVDTKEGRLLLRAVGLIIGQAPGFKGKSPEEVLTYLEDGHNRLLTAAEGLGKALAANHAPSK